ncbi:MAG: hypothetical protein ABTQ27_01910 [Amaricoccus sp.]|uniref:hypothetical protein n=1 Tax=Amaricoccus sp. TaxID=1872485 RepID=UPI003314EC7E
MTDIPTLDTIEEMLDLVAEWLIAAYGARIAAVSLEIEGHYGPISDCYGIVPITLDRGRDADGHPETRETLPTREICGRAEALFQRLCPAIRFDHDNARDVRHVGSSRLVRASDVSAHRRIELRRLHGVLAPDAPGR